MAIDKTQGCQIDLDAGQGQIISGVIIDDIRSPCTQLSIVFESFNKLTFSTMSTNYFSYFAKEWCPQSFSETMCPDGRWHYEMDCLPFQASIEVMSPFANIRDLVSEVGLELTVNSDALEIEYPTIGLTVAELVAELRRREFEKAFLKRQMGDAWILYFNSDCLMSMKWSKMLKNQAKELVSPSGMQGSNTVISVDSYRKGCYQCSKLWEKWKQSDFLKRMLGEFIEIETPTPSIFLDTYTMKFADGTEFERNETYLCVRVERDVSDITKQNQLFAKIEHMEENT